MSRTHRSFANVPVGTKYILEASGPFIRRRVKYPDGHVVVLPKRKAASCECSQYIGISIVPSKKDTNETVTTATKI